MFNLYENCFEGKLTEKQNEQLKILKSNDSKIQVFEPLEKNSFGYWEFTNLGIKEACQNLIDKYDPKSLFEAGLIQRRKNRFKSKEILVRKGKWIDENNCRLGLLITFDEYIFTGIGLCEAEENWNRKNLKVPNKKRSVCKKEDQQSTPITIELNITKKVKCNVCYA